MPWLCIAYLNCDFNSLNKAENIRKQRKLTVSRKNVFCLATKAAHCRYCRNNFLNKKKTFWIENENLQLLCLIFITMQNPFALKTINPTPRKEHKTEKERMRRNAKQMKMTQYVFKSTCNLWSHQPHCMPLPNFIHK